MKIARFGLALGVLVLALGGCSSESVDPNQQCNGKCEHTATVYRAVMDKVNAVGKWVANEPGEVPMVTIEDAYQVEMMLEGGKSLVAKTHMFGTEKVTIIPYDNEDDTTDAAGNPVRGDQAVAEALAPGQIGYAIKHHRPEHRVLHLTSEQAPSESDMKENFKLNDTHIELVVGVERDGKPGAITLNNPQNYEEGRFGTPDYPMVFVKPIYPEEIEHEGLVKKFNDNIRTMMVGFNAASDFPGDYNGGDPLGAQNPEQVKVLVANMILAIAGPVKNDNINNPETITQQARDWFEDELNQIYCAELAHVSSSAGMIVPLNWANVKKLQSLTVKADQMTEGEWETIWNTFQRYIKEHNEGKETPFLKLNDNKRVALVKLAPAADTATDQVAGNIPSDLMPAANYIDDPSAEDQLAFQPMTMADIIRHFLRTHVPRDPEVNGTSAAVAKLAGISASSVTPAIVEQAMAPIQGALLKSLEMGIYNAMGLIPANEKNGGTLTSADQEKIGMRKTVVKPLFDAITEVVGSSFDSYEDFTNALETTTLKVTGHPLNGLPLMLAAQNLTGPRPGARPGEGLFVPPSLLHTIAQGAHPGGLLGLQYLGHGLHFSLVQPASNP